jgi:hypothetical protein
VAPFVLGATTMRYVFIALLVLHGAIHLMGFAKAFGLADMAQLTQPISRAWGLVWLGAAIAMVASAVLFLVARQGFWLVGSVALVLSQVAIVSSWQDAKFGTLANVVVLVGVALGFASHGPGSLWAEYQENVKSSPKRITEGSVVREEELLALPEPVRKYLRVTGTVGQPRVHDFKAIWKGRIRGAATEEWMVFDAEQLNVLGPESSRLFFMDATMKHLPVSIFHRFVGKNATFRVRLLSAFTMVDAKGPEMDRSETVTLFNDACFLAPSSLLEPSVRWESIDPRSARAHYTRGAQTISAELRFDDAGELVDFVSDDRFAASPDGKSFALKRWSTPLKNYRAFGARRVPTFGEARWDDPKGAFTYIELSLVSIVYDVAAR